MELLEIISLNWVSGICLVLGLVFVVIEMFTPGFGVPGITGMVLLLVGVIAAADSLVEMLVLIILIILLLCLLATIAVRSASKGSLAKSPIILKAAASKQDGFTSGEDMAYFLGRRGVVTAMLRPVGVADFDGVKLEVLSEGEVIEVGCAVTVVKVEGRKLVVKRA